MSAPKVSRATLRPAADAAVPLLLLLLAVLFGLQAHGLRKHPTVVVTWATASEVQTAGFHVYRADDPHGSPERVSAQLLPATDDPLAGGTYTFVDRAVTAGTTYHYWLEDVDLSGTMTRHGPTRAVVTAWPWRAWAAAAGLVLAAAAVSARPRRRSAAGGAAELEMPSETRHHDP